MGRTFPPGRLSPEYHSAALYHPLKRAAYERQLVINFKNQAGSLGKSRYLLDKHARGFAAGGSKGQQLCM